MAYLTLGMTTIVMLVVFAIDTIQKRQGHSR
jgi:hypothetical protein